MTRFVLDASVALSWIFDDEFSQYAESIAKVLGSGRAIVPVVWPLEIVNALLIAVRRNRLQAPTTPALFNALSRLRIDVDRAIPPESLAYTILSLGLAHNLSAYDASYLELAVRHGLPLATQDRRLAQAAANAGVEILLP
jgi:predicted nucleic acid-binding protein